MQSFDLFSLGHSNLPIERFLTILQAVGVHSIADVRSTPMSRRFPWFSRKALAARLVQEGMSYEWYGDALGGRPRNSELYSEGIADYEAMSRQPDFQAGIEKLSALAARCRVSLLCAEREPLDCHRCLLVARALAEQGLAIGHILHNGIIESHTTIEQRLLALNGQGDDLFLTGQNDRLAAAYRCRARAVAYRAKADGGSSVAERR